MEIIKNSAHKFAYVIALDDVPWYRPISKYAIEYKKCKIPPKAVIISVVLIDSFVRVIDRRGSNSKNLK